MLTTSSLYLLLNCKTKQDSIRLITYLSSIEKISFCIDRLKSFSTGIEQVGFIYLHLSLLHVIILRLKINIILEEVQVLRNMLPSFTLQKNFILNTNYFNNPITTVNIEKSSSSSSSS